MNIIVEKVMDKKKKIYEVSYSKNIQEYLKYHLIPNLNITTIIQCLYFKTSNYSRDSYFSYITNN